MPRRIALLRAINVGGRTVRMERLRAEFEALGFADVSTLIASGNVRFTAAAEDDVALEARIERGLATALGFEVATFVRSPAELAAAAGCRPFDGAEEQAAAWMIAFLHAAPAAAAMERLMRHRSEVDDFVAVGREVHWLCRTRVSESKFSGAVLERALGAPSTMRSVTTVRKLAADGG
jgi:uncharacterized protein (DUF1697 family)